MRQNEAGENFTTVALAGVHSADAITLPDNLLEATGTYALVTPSTSWATTPTASPGTLMVTTSRSILWSN